VIAVIELLTFWSPALINVSIQRSSANTDLTTVVSMTGNRLPDGRQRSSPGLILSTDVNAVGTGTTMQSAIGLANTLVATILDENQEIPLTPGESIQLFCNTVNIQMNGSFFWRERFLEEAERT
jgi:hypothetical protein